MTKSNQGRLLVVDDEAELTKALCEMLAEQNYAVTGATSAKDGLKALAAGSFDVLLSDLMMPGMDGIQLLREALAIDPQLVGIIMTGQGTVQTAVEAMKMGAFDYVLKPFKLHAILPIIDRAVGVRRLRMENVRLRQWLERLTYESPRYTLVGSSVAMQRVVRLIEKVAATDATVLIRGASGTGKELVARALHSNSPRRDRSLVTVNCATLQETLLESELFGHEKGAFTGATQAKAGLIEVAEGGTLFIDEIAEMAPGLQAKLLRVLENGCYRRVGSAQETHADVRIVAATNKNLEEEQKAGRFREDLYYRLNVVAVQLPLLKDRPEDIPELARHFLATRQIGPRPFTIAPETMEALCRHDWPGNVRELANLLERAQILAENQTITLDDFPDHFADTHSPVHAASSHPLHLREVERQHVQEVLRLEKGNKVHAAKTLGISRRALYRLLNKFHITSDPSGGESTP